jgi:prepilin-type N-terminal cleavage/methylation domain-containing protein
MNDECQMTKGEGMTKPECRTPEVLAANPLAARAARPSLPGLGLRHSSFLRPSSVGVRHSRAFSLIELIIVVAIMALLASLTFPIMGAVRKTMIRNRARGALIGMETAMEAYKDKFGHYPPDNPVLKNGVTWYETNQLYYELIGTTNVPSSPPIFKTLDGSSQLLSTDVPLVFQSGVSGFVNCSQAGNADEAPTGMSFLRDLKANQFLIVPINSKNCAVLGCGVDGPADIYQNPPAGLPKINPWRYNSSNPVHNTKSFDLWIDVIVGGKTNRICNWSDQPLLVNQPYPLQ